MMQKSSVNTSKNPGFNQDVTIYTDGGCHNNGPRKGDGAWAFVEFREGEDDVLVHCGAVTDTTNNRTEMLAVIFGIRNYSEHTNVHVISDSGYIVKGYNHPSYLDSWIRNAWRLSAGGEVQNIDLWQKILGLTFNHGVKFTLVRGHYKDPNPTHALWNSIVDRACTHIIQNRMEARLATLSYNMKTKKFTELMIL